MELQPLYLDFFKKVSIKKIFQAKNIKIFHYLQFSLFNANFLKFKLRFKIKEILFDQVFNK